MLLALLVLLQQDEVIPRASKAVYHPAVLSCEKAEGLLDSDPREATRLLDEILANPKIEKRECRMKIVIQPGTESKWYDFYPFQFRGRAAVKLSEGAQGEDKVRLLERAIQDLQKSQELGVKASDPVLKAARGKLEQARLAAAAAGDDPEPPFRRAWNELLDAARFAEAKAHVEGKGPFLSQEKKAQYLGETARKSLAHAGQAADRFIGELARAASVRDLAGLRPDAFDLPAREMLLQTGEKYEWCVRARATLAKLRGGEEALAEILDRAVESIGPDPDGPAFPAVERLGWSALEAGVRRRAEEARGAAADRRQALRSEAEGMVALWGAFEKRSRAAAEARPELLKRVPARQPAALLAEFPVEASLEAVLAALDGSVTADDPERALAEAEKAVQKLLEGGERLTVESRRRVLSLGVAARALRGFLAEEPLEDVVRAARALAPDLAQLGGPADEVKRYGPKVGEVFKRLR